MQSNFKTSASLSEPLGTQLRANHRGSLAQKFASVSLALAISTGLSACVSRGEIRANLWLNNAQIPKELCDKEPALKDYGFFRRLDSGKLEFVSWCDPLARRWLAIFDDDLERLLDKTLPKEK